MRIKRIVLIVSISLLTISIRAQNNLENLLMEEMGKTVDYAMGTFISNNILNSQSTEMLNISGLGFRISHKFGKLNTGSNNFNGFDDATTFMEVNYGVTDWMNIGVGRATFDELVNGYAKFRVLRQSTGARVMPVSAVILLIANYKTCKYDNEERNKNIIDRFDYTSQLLLSRKFSNKFSAQLMPAFIHRNLVETTNDKNDIIAVGMGASYKILPQFSVKAEYFWVQNHDTPNLKFYDPVSMGLCYQSSRHAFELFVTNSQSITDNNFIANTTCNFWEGDIRVGFNILTVFSLNRKK